MRWLLLIPLLFADTLRAESPSFKADIAPVMVQRCISCHGSNKAKADYRLDSFAALRKPGSSGEKPMEEIVRRITSVDAEERMPPGDDPLSSTEIATFKKWLADGARFDGPNETSALKSYLPPRSHPAAPEKYPATIGIFAVAFSADGSELAVGGHNEITVWNVANGQLVRRMGHMPQRIQSLHFDVDGKNLLVGGGTPGEYGEALLIDFKTGTKIRTFGTFEDIVLSCVWDRDCHRVAAASADKSVKVWKATGEAIWQTQLHSDWATGVAFSPDGKYVVSGSKDMTVKIYESETGNLFTTYNGHRRQFGPQSGRFAVYDVIFTQKGSEAISAGEGSVMRCWNPETVKEESGSARDMEARFASQGSSRFLLHNAPKPVFKVVERHGRIFSVAGDGIVREHKLDTETPLREFVGHPDWLYALDFHEGSNRLATAGYDGQVKIWDGASAKCLLTFVASPGR